MPSKDSQKKLDEWLKENNQPVHPRAHTYVNNNKSVNVRKPNINNHQPADQAATIAHLKSELKNAKNAAANAERSRDQVVNAHQASQEDKGIHKVIHGFSERFDKTYNVPIIKADGKETTYKLHIILKPLTAADQYEVYAEEENLTNNMGRFFEANEHVVLQAFTTMRVAGIKVPDGFKDPKKLYRMQLLMQVYFDYLDWERRFCSHIKE